MENKKTILTLVICLILVGIGTIINNLVFKTEDKTVDKGKNYNELVSRGYTLADLNKPSKLIDGYKIYTKKDNDYLNNNEKITILVENNIAYFKYLENKYQINIENVIDYYMYVNDNTMHIYLLSNDYKIYYLNYKININDEILNTIDLMCNSFKLINTDKNIVSLKKIVTIHKLLDNTNYEYLVGVSNDKKEYKINNETLEEINDYYDKVYYYNDEVYVDDKNELMISNQDTLFKVKYILSNYFVSNDNYLYKVDNKNITKEYNEKIQYMFYYKYDNIFKLAFIFEDNSMKHIDLIIKDYGYEIQGIDIKTKK